MLRTIRNFPSEYVAQRDVHIWLPEQYPALAAQGIKFAVVYMHDGQMLFDSTTTWNQKEWGIDEASQALISQNTVRPYIVVGINNGGDNLRYPEYMPQKPFASLPTAVKENLHEEMALTAPIQSDAYLQFIVNELKPYVDQNYATSTDRQDTFIAGASMGGLISWYAVAEYPEVFAGCLCFSTHFIGGPDLVDDTIFNKFKQYMAKHLPIKGSHFLYFDYGDQTLDQYYPPFHEKLAAFLTQKDANKNSLVIRFYPGDAHDEIAWRKRFPLALIEAFGSQLTKGQ